MTRQEKCIFFIQNIHIAKFLKLENFICLASDNEIYKHFSSKTKLIENKFLCKKYCIQFKTTGKSSEINILSKKTFISGGNNENIK